MLPFAPQASGSITLFQHKRDALYNTTVIGAGAGGVAASSDVWALLQSRGLDSFGGGATAAATMAAVSQLAEENACWREVCVDKAPLDALLTEKEASAARVVKIDVEGGEWAVIRGMSHLLGEEACNCDGLQGRLRHTELEIVVEVTPKWLKKQSCSVEQLLSYMESRGFHAYVLHEDYEVGRCAAGRRFDHQGQSVRPQRHRTGAEGLESFEQVDVIFSRRDAEQL